MPREPNESKSPVDDEFNDMDHLGPEMHVLFLNHATTYSNLMEQKLRRRGFSVTNVSDLASAEEEWNLGVHDLILVDHSISLGVRLLLLKTSGERHRSIPTVMIFEPDAHKDAVLASEQGALACVFRDSRQEYLTRVTALIESHARQSNFAKTEWIPSDRDVGDTDEIDLEKLAAEMSGKTADIAPAYLIVLGGPDVGRTAQIDDAICVIGRDSSCQLCLTDEAVSRYHASIKLLPGGITEISDLHSSNGIYLHGQRISTAYLRGGDEILIGKNTLIKFQR